MKRRIEQLQMRLEEWKVEALLIERPVDLFYLTGLDLSKGSLWINAKEAELFVDGRYFTYASKRAPCIVKKWDQRRERFHGKIGIDSAWMTIEEWNRLTYQEPNCEFVPISRPTRQMRAVKGPGEIEKMRRAADLTWEGVQHLSRLFKEGVTERELALEFESFVKRRGASGLSFEPIIAFGEHSALPHHRASSTPLAVNQPILIDVGAIVDHYSADMTRVFFFDEPPQEIKRLALLVEQAEEIARGHVRVGQSIGSIDLAVREFFARQGVEELFVHSLGHGIGLETHEYPLIRFDGEHADELIRLGMVITIEPGLYRPGLGGIRHENTGVVTDKGFESFYRA